MRRYLALLLVASLALLATSAAHAQGSEQQSILAKVISKLLSSPEGQVRIGSIEGPLSSDALIRDIEVADKDGPWLRVDRARLIWRRAALLTRRLEVDQLEIGRIEILRRPAPAPASAADPEPLIPELPVKVEIKAFTVAELALGAPLAGTAARLSLTGMARLGAPADGLQATLSARRLDRDGDSQITLQFVPKAETLDLALRHRESAGGLIAHLLDLPGRPAVELDVTGQGPLDNWRGQLAFTAGASASARGQATIVRQGALRRADLDVTGQIQGVLPPVAATIFAGATSVKGQIDFADDGAMMLHGLRLASDQAELSVTGTVSANQELDVRAVARSLTRTGEANPRVAALKSLMLDARATGPLASPAIDGRLDAEISRLDAFARDIGVPLRGTARLTAQIAGKPSEKMMSANLSFTGAGLNFNNGPLNALLGEQATLIGKASLSGDRIGIESVQIKGRRIDAILIGTLDTASSTARGALTLAGKLDGRPLSGQTTFAAMPGGGIDIPVFAIKLAGGQIAGTIKSATDGLMTGGFTADFPDLGQLSNALGTTMRGALKAQATLSSAQGKQQTTLTAKGRGLSGFGAQLASLEGEASLSGDLAHPVGTFRAALAGVTHPEIQRTGMSRLDLTSTGSLAGDHAILNADIKGGPQFAVKLSGTVPFAESGTLGLKVTGNIDAALANAKLTGGAQRVAGKVSIDGTVRGTRANPLIDGAAIISNGAFTDLIQGTRMTAITGRIVGAGTSLRLDGLTASTPGGGRIAMTGTVQADLARGLPANLRMTGENAQLIDNDIVDLVAGLDLTITGPLASAPVISGQVNIVSFDVTIPDKLPADAAPLSNARHLSPPEQTRERLKMAQRASDRDRKRKAGATGNARLAVKVIAPSHIFVRGRGIDAELGGEITLTGALLAPRATGAFDMRRGQINMLTQRLEFSRGRLTFLGDLLPELDFVAATAAGGITAKVSVTGRADSPAFALSSEPQLPPDEVLSRLMFERAVGSLSPLQAVQLAQAVARLTGRGGPDFLERTRQALGVDTLDVNAGKDGPTVGASRYITRDIRLGVKAGARPEQSGVTANVDLGRRIRLQGETTSGGKTSIGIGAEIEY